jgi:hypothetical protein
VTAPDDGAVADSAPIELCPRCALRDVEDDRTGWCRKCAEDGALEKYVNRNDEELARLQKNWQRRTKRAFSDAPAALAERQRWHRLKEKTRPRQPADPYVNPLQLAFSALQELGHVKVAIRSNNRARDHVERAEEAIKQLAHGPESLPSPPKEERKFSPGKVGMHNRWHRDAGKPCNCPPALAEALRSRPST